MSETQEETQAAPDTAPDAPITEEQVQEAQEGAPADPGESPFQAPETPAAPDEGEEADEEAEGDEEPAGTPTEAAREPGVAEAGLLSEREIEKRFGKLDAENTRHRKRLGEILEEDSLHIVPCPVCMESFHGWVFDPQHIPLSDEQRERTLQLLNLADFEDIPQASWAVTCDTCKGHGRVKTGSKAEGREVTTCEDCGGAGWHNLHERQRANGHAEAQPTTVTGPTVYGTEEPDPRVQSLREEGWYVSAPLKLPAGT